MAVNETRPMLRIPNFVVESQTDLSNIWSDIEHDLCIYLGGYISKEVYKAGIKAYPQGSREAFLLARNLLDGSPGLICHNRYVKNAILTEAQAVIDAVDALVKIEFACRRDSSTDEESLIRIRQQLSEFIDHWITEGTAQE